MTELKEQWVAALRSGEYKQGHGVLRRGDSYCCLGVLEDLVGSQWIPDYEDYETVYKLQNGIYDERTRLLPSTAKAVKISFTQGIYCSQLNDSNHSFNEIADVIEKMNFVADIHCSLCNGFHHNLFCPEWKD